MSHTVSAAAQPQSLSVVGHLRALSVLGLPLVGGHVAQFAIGLTDTAMLGWYGAPELAAVTLASSFFFLFFLLGSGFAFALMPVVAAAQAEADGAARDRRIRRAARMTLWLSLAYACLIMPVMLNAEAILLLLGQTPTVAQDAGAYLQVAGWGMGPALLVMVLKSYLGGLERTMAVLWVTLVAAAVNAVANYLLIFGNFGLPELGITGAALASLMTQAVSVLVMIAYCQRVLPEHALWRNLHRPDWEMMGEIFRHGLPIGLTTLTEVSLFSASALMMGWLGSDVLAAHGVAISLAGITFMVHLGLSNAATIRVGNAMGRGDKAHLQRGALVVTCLSLCLACLTVVVFLTFPEPLISLFLAEDEPRRDEILGVGVTLLALAGLFQLMDAMQVIALGLLRGLLDTGVPMVLATLSYWGVGLPAGYVLGFVFDFGGAGVWMGLVAGLSSAGGLLMLRFWKQMLPRLSPQAR